VTDNSPATSHAEDNAKVLGDDEQFHITDDPIDLSHYSFEAWIAFGFFWVLALNIFYQFFTRYVLNDSASWTEEIARYLLICVVFVGMAAAVRDNRHIHVDFFYRMMPKWFARGVSTAVDIVRFVFFAVATVLTWQMMQKMGSYKMTIIELPMNTVYSVCMFGFACAAVRAVQVAFRHWRQGYSVLERPESAITETI
jgi:TRAP-type transport system small permease protein